MTSIQQEVLDKLQEYIDALEFVNRNYVTYVHTRNDTEYTGPQVRTDETLELIERAKHSWNVGEVRDIDNDYCDKCNQTYFVYQLMEDEGSVLFCVDGLDDTHKWVHVESRDDDYCENCESPYWQSKMTDCMNIPGAKHYWVKEDGSQR